MTIHGTGKLRNKEHMVKAQSFDEQVQFAMFAENFMDCFEPAIDNLAKRGIKLAVNAGAGYQGASLDATQFTISASPRPGVTFAQVEQVVDRVISDVAQNTVRAEDLERVKTQLIAEAIYAQDNQATLARWYGGGLTTGSSIEDIRSWPDRIRAVTAEQVRAVAQKWLDKKRSVTGYLIKDTAQKREEKRS